MCIVVAIGAYSLVILEMSLPHKMDLVPRHNNLLGHAITNVLIALIIASDKSWLWEA